MASDRLSFPDSEALFPPRDESSRLLVGCRRLDYSASRIATAVEDCNAHVLNLNVTDLGASLGKEEDGAATVVVDLRVSHRSPEAIGRSLERYGYNVLLAGSQSDFLDDDPRADSLRARIDELLRYIDL